MVQLLIVGHVGGGIHGGGSGFQHCGCGRGQHDNTNSTY